MAPMKIARYDFACCRVGNHVYVIGGWTTLSIPLKSVEMYNLDTDTWTDGEGLLKALFDLYVCAVMLAINLSSFTFIFHILK